MREARFSFLSLIAALTLACDKGASSPAARRTPVKDVVATVNGVPITGAALRLETRGADPHGTAPPHNVLEDVVRQELAAQRALELGLDADPAYQDELARLEAQVAAFRRKKLSELFYERHVAPRAAVSDADARRLYDEQAERIQTELHVWQILRRKEHEIEEVARELAAGTPFEEVARRQFEHLPEAGRKPWDLGYLRWTQVPEAWRDVVYGLEKGQTSAILRGPNDRYWIVRVVDRRRNPEITFESVKDVLVEQLRETRLRTLRAEADRELRSRSSVIVLEPLATTGR